LDQTGEIKVPPARIVGGPALLTGILFLRQMRGRDDAKDRCSASLLLAAKLLRSHTIYVATS